MSEKILTVENCGGCIHFITTCQNTCGCLHPGGDCDTVVGLPNESRKLMPKKCPLDSRPTKDEASFILTIGIIENWPKNKLLEKLGWEK